MKRMLMPLLLWATLCADAQTPAANPLFRHIPPDADHLYHLNSPVLFKDFSWDQLLGMLPVEPAPGSPDIEPELRGYAFQAGIDTRQDLLIASSNRGQQDSFQYYTFLFHLADSGKYIRYLQQKIKPLRPQPIQGVHAEGSMLVGTAFTDRLGVLVLMDAPTNQHAAVRSIPTVQWQMMNARRAAAALRGVNHSFFTADPAFLATFNDGADLHFYTRQGSILTLPREIVKATEPKSEVLTFINSFGHSRPVLGSLRAQKGKLTYISSQPASPAESRFSNQLLDSNLLGAVLANKRVLGVASINLDLAGSVAKVLTQGNIHTQYKKLVADGGDPMHALGRHLLLLSMEPDFTTDSSKQPLLLLGLTTIGNPSAFDKFAGRLEAQHIYHVVEDSFVVFAKRRDLAETFFTTPVDRQPVVLPPHMLTYPIAFEFNLEALVELLHRYPSVDDSISASQRYYYSIFDRLSGISFGTGGVQNGRSTTFFQLDFADKEKNPILTLLQLIKNRPKQ